MKNINLELLPHQKRTVRKVIDELDGRAILADEVGMGKTIEAGMILREYIKRGEIKKLLILVPASLAFQWVNEMVNKLKIENIYFNRKVDEAHKLKNSDTLNWKFVNRLKKKYCLFLTATPVQNNLKELYNLIKILYPEQYLDYHDFKKKYVEGKYLIKNKLELKDELSNVMIRNYHKQIKNVIGNRQIKQIFVDLTEKEKKLYNKVTKYLQKYKKQKIYFTFVDLSKRNMQ